jgi:hypothetical protein
MTKDSVSNFDILVIGTCLGFGAWDLEFGVDWRTDDQPTSVR